MLTITLDETRQKEIDREAHTINFAEACEANNDRFFEAVDAIPEPEPKPDHKAEAYERATPRVQQLQRHYNTASSRFHAARAIATYVAIQAKKIGANPNGIICRKTEDERTWEVIWEEGPYEWAISLCGGSNIYGSEHGYGPGTEADFDTYGQRFYCECQNSYTLVIAE